MRGPSVWQESITLHFLWVLHCVRAEAGQETEPLQTLKNFKRTRHPDQNKRSYRAKSAMTDSVRDCVLSVCTRTTCEKHKHASGTTERNSVFQDHTGLFSLWWNNKNNFHREWSQCRQAPRHALTWPSEHGCAAWRHDMACKKEWENILCRVLSLWWSSHLNIRRGWSQRRRFHRHAFTNPLKHGRANDNTTLKYKTSAGANVTLHDAGKKRRGIRLLLTGNLGRSNVLRNGHVQRCRWLCFRLRLAGFHLVVFHGSMWASCRNDKHEAQLLCDIPSKLPLWGGSARVPLLSEVLHWILSRITANQAEDGARQSKTFVDGHIVWNSVASVRHTVRRASQNVKDSLGRHAHGGHAERPQTWSASCALGKS